VTDATTARQIRFTRRSPAYWRVTFDHHVNRAFPDAEPAPSSIRLPRGFRRSTNTRSRRRNVSWTSTACPPWSREVEMRLGYHVGLLGGNDPRNKW